MDRVKIIEVKENVLGSNDERAEILRRQMKKEGTYFVNLMSSPGSGKTTTLLQTIKQLNGKYRVGIMEADIDSAVDAQTMVESGIPAIQVHTGGMCHLDAAMAKQGLDELEASQYDLVFLENVGNLICPAEFDTGAACNMMLLSVPEGDDKPLKYPLMFSMTDVVLINKIDYLSVADFDVDACKSRIRNLNPDVAIFEVSAKTGEGYEAWIKWLCDRIEAWKKA